MPGTYRGRSRHRLPRREGARIAGRTGGVPQYVPADGVHTWHRIPAKVFQVSLPAVHLPRNPCKSVPGVLSCRPPATESLQKRSRCPFLPSTCHGIPAKVCQVASSCFLPATAVHLITGCWGFSVGHVAVFSMKRATISTPAAAEYMYLSENHDVSRMVQLRVSHVWTHLQ